MEYQPTLLAVQQLLLDPNNYRFLDQKNYVRVEPNRFHEASVQSKASELIRSDGPEELRALKESILANGYVPLEALVVRPYEFRPDLYVVIEGNRRVAAVRWLRQDCEAGASIPQKLLDEISQLPAIVMDPKDPGNESLQRVLMGLRHVSGIKQWGGYQRARLIVTLVDEGSMGISEAAREIGMTPYEATRRYRAFKALSQMQQNEEFGALATPEMYRLFHEAVAQPKIKDWLGWNDAKFKFSNQEETREFYRLLVPCAPEDEEEMPRTQTAKIRTYEDVRSLKEILGNVEAEESLLDPIQTLADALAIAKASVASNWLPRLNAAKQALDKLPVETLKNLTDADIEAMRALCATLEERLSDWASLTGHEK